VAHLSSHTGARPCRNCGTRPEIVAEWAGPMTGKTRRLYTFCALCLAEVIDDAYGWKISRNVAQGLVAQRLGQEIQHAKKAAKARAARATA